MLTRHAASRPEDAVTPEEEIKDPLVLEFLDLKDEYSESDLEEALIQRLEEFLLELGSDFAFVGRQRRLHVADTWYRIDLLFFHRRLRCLVVIDLKLSELTPQDAGQMHMYLNYAREHWTRPDENPPVVCAMPTSASTGRRVATWRNWMSRSAKSNPTTGSWRGSYRSTCSPTPGHWAFTSTPISAACWTAWRRSSCWPSIVPPSIATRQRGRRVVQRVT